jgi:hypothetical protein
VLISLLLYVYGECWSFRIGCEHKERNRQTEMVAERLAEVEIQKKGDRETESNVQKQKIKETQIKDTERKSERHRDRLNHKGIETRRKSQRYGKFLSGGACIIKT